MVFFDLNIPYHESRRHPNPTLKATRLKLTTHAITLGYTAVAYNHTIKGVISEADRCSITRFPLSDLCKLSPSLKSSVLFHQNLLNIPKTMPLRQYTRVTVLVEEKKQADALNIANAVLKTYDVVAVRPLNQYTFEQACKNAQVDIISIDFSDKLPFRLNQAMVKEAVKRGVYFEITYSCLVADAQARRQMISNAKLLVNWTRGRSLIISSGAPSVTELRGPYDAANLSSLLGLAMEKSKAAISKNCRSLIANAYKKKHCYEGVIKAEKLPPGEEMNFDDFLNWDPISSAEGDLTLDDMGKSFSASCTVSKAPKAIDFTSALDGIHSHGLQIKDIISRKVAVAERFSVSKDITTPAGQGSVILVCETPEQPLGSCSLPKKEPALAKSMVEPSGSDLEVSLPCDLSNFTSSELNDVGAVSAKEVENVQVFDSKNAESRCSQSLSSTGSDGKTDILSCNDQCALASIPTNSFSSSPFYCDQSKLSSSVRLDIFTKSSTVARSMAEANHEAKSVNRSGEELRVASCAEALHDNGTEREVRDTKNQIEAERVSRNDEELPPVLCEVSVHSSRMEKNKFIEEWDTSVVQIGSQVEKCDDHKITDNEGPIFNKDPSTLSYERLVDEDITVTGDVSATILDEPHLTDICNHSKTEDCAVTHDETGDHETIISQMHADGHAPTNSKLPDNSPPGRGGEKRKISGRMSLFPFKRFISPRPLRKKARK